MTLWLSETSEYVNPYSTNWHYLDNMTYLQMKPLEKMRYDNFFPYIHIDLWIIPITNTLKKDIGSSVENFIENLNTAIKRL